MKGLLYKDAQLILNKVKIINRIFIALALFLITIFARESGTIFLLIVLPISLASLPTTLVVSDSENGWNQFVGVFPISKSKIILARYLSCISFILLVSSIVLSLSLATHVMFNQYSLNLHLIMALIGVIFGIMYVALLLPSVYAFGAFGNTIVNILVLSLVMGLVYGLQKTTFGMIFINWISSANHFLLVISIIILVSIMIGVSFVLSTKIYCKIFMK